MKKDIKRVKRVKKGKKGRKTKKKGRKTVFPYLNRMPTPGAKPGLPLYRGPKNTRKQNKNKNKTPIALRNKPKGEHYNNLFNGYNLTKRENIERFLRNHGLLEEQNPYRTPKSPKSPSRTKKRYRSRKN